MAVEAVNGLRLLILCAFGDISMPEGIVGDYQGIFGQ